MANRKVNFFINEYYHIYNRGVEKRLIFLDNPDYNRFLALLYVCNSKKQVLMRNTFPSGVSFKLFDGFSKGESLVDIVSYCLMPNHFHLVLRERVEGGISLFMKKLSTGYSMYFNKKYERSGGLFGGTFKSEHINNDSYFNYIFSYVNLNPLKLFNLRWKESDFLNKNSSKEFLLKYRYSSYLDCIGFDRQEKIILNREFLPGHIQDFNEYEDFIDAMLD